MKNIVLSAVAVLAMSSFAVAGGDIAPVEVPMVVEPVIDDSGFYLGLAYSALNMTNEYETYRYSYTDFDKSLDEVMVQAGYKFNSYVAVEGRYWFGLSGDTQWPEYYEQYGVADTTVDAWGIYVKPMYPVTEEFDIYALLGYASSNIAIDDFGNVSNLTSDVDLDGFSWGLGAAYSFTENLSVFVDYVSLYNESHFESYADVESDTTIDTWNFGVTYKF